MKNFNSNKLKVTDNIIMNSDSYKISHWMFLERETTYSQAYIEARVGGDFPETVVFGFQYLIMTQFLDPVTAEMVDQADRILTAHGVPFNREGWDRIVNKHNGFFPIRIKAVPEGTVIPISNVVALVESTDKRFNAAWAADFIETKLLRVWYPTTIATLGREFKKVITASLEKTGNPELATTMFTGDPTVADGKLIDFGARGVSCKEQAMIGGAAHLINFSGTDNLLGMGMIMDYYMEDDTVVPAFSIPATEHTITIAWGKDREFMFYNNLVREILIKTGICSVVIDSYDSMRAITMFGEIRETIEKNGRIVIRPDSGDPVESTEMVIKKLDEVFGSTVNNKGYKVLNPCVRMIQGDGITLKVVKDILDNFERLGYSADNINFGSGGGLLQMVNRDTMRFAMKGSHVVVDLDERDIQKVPVSDLSKASKKGKLRLLRNENTGEYRTINQHDEVKEGEVDVLRTIYENGELLVWDHIDDIRARAAL